MLHPHGLTSWVLAGCLIIPGGVVALAQGRDDRPEARALSALADEVRLLRVAVEELTRSQAQAQALSALVAVQDSRVRQIGARLEASRRERDSVTTRAQLVAVQLAAADAERRHATAAARLAELDDVIERLTLEQSAVFEREQESRRREEDLAKQFDLEDARWNDVVVRLQELGR